MNETIDEKQIAIIEKRVAPLITRATKIIITTQSEQDRAGELLTALNIEADAFKTLKENITRPMNQALKAVREIFKPREVKLDEAISAIRSAMGDYQMLEDQKAKDKEAKLAARVEKRTMKAETAVRKMGEIDAPAEYIATAGGSVKFRDSVVLNIIHRNKIVEFLSAHHPGLLEFSDGDVIKLMKEGVNIPGAALETKKVVVNSR